jgi:integrase
MQWVELGQDFSIWTLPGSRTKNRTANVLPLPAVAQALLTSAYRISDRLVFPGRFDKPFMGWNKGKLRLDAACGFSNWTLHDLRRTLATGLQKLGVRLEVTEAVLNHSSGSRSGIVGVYQRHDWLPEKKAALAAWANHIASIAEEIEPATNIVALSA